MLAQSMSLAGVWSALSKASDHAPAWVGLAAGFVGGAFFYGFATFVQPWLEDRQSERQARREYEYDARKHLYRECEPLVFQARELCEFADRRIKAIARNVASPRCDRSGTKVRDFDPEGYYFRASLYFLIAPLVPFQMMRRSLSDIDLALDPYLGAQYALFKLLYRSFADGERIAAEKPPVKGYSARETPGQELPLGTLDSVINSLIVPATSTSVSRVKSFGEFENEFRDSGSGTYRTFSDYAPCFADFDPANKPVLWRTLIVHAHIYRVICGFRRSDVPRSGEVSLVLQPFNALERKSYDLKCDHEDAKETEQRFEAARAYLASRIAENRTLKALFADHTRELITENP
jgi:hypothetical protein